MEDIKDCERKLHHPKPPTLEQVIHAEESNAHRGHLLFPSHPELAELHDATHYQMAQWLKELKEYREQDGRKVIEKMDS